MVGLVFFWKFSSCFQICDLREVYKPCGSKTIIHLALSCAGHSLKAGNPQPEDPKHSSIPFPAESGLQSLIFCMAPPRHPVCHVYLQQMKEERIWQGQRDYKLHFQLQKRPQVVLDLFVLGILLQLLPEYRGPQRENLTKGIHSGLAHLFHLDLKLIPLPYSQRQAESVQGWSFIV